ncbi:MAG: hypothetical protein G01um101438_772 [Parcubacteria group bacterium Gr01-1014_38]|nr:MAG: hypothetical protein G01um101438_772 [Parcubacteria group bacterium Gr01-1014_38]
MEIRVRRGAASPRLNQRQIDERRGEIERELTALLARALAQSDDSRIRRAWEAVQGVPEKVESSLLSA